MNNQMSFFKQYESDNKLINKMVTDVFRLDQYSSSLNQPMSEQNQNSFHSRQQVSNMQEELSDMPFSFDRKHEQSLEDNSFSSKRTPEPRKESQINFQFDLGYENLP